MWARMLGSTYNGATAGELAWVSTLIVSQSLADVGYLTRRLFNLALDRQSISLLSLPFSGVIARIALSGIPLASGD